MSILIDSQYFGAITEIKNLIDIDAAYLDISAFYQKHSFANRLFLAGSQGLLDLSIPIQGGRAKKQLLKEVRINHNTNWRIKHWRTIESCYRKSPWFEFYELELKEFYDQEFEFLWQWNFSLLEWVLRRTGIATKIIPYFGLTPLPESILDKTKIIYPKSYIQTWKDSAFPAYHQVFLDRNDFLPNLCILDLMFCMGPRSIDYLK